MRLDLALVAQHPGLSRRRAQAAVEKGQVTVDGHPVIEPGSPVGPQARVHWDVNRPARPRVRPPLPLLYADEWLLVVDKPAGLLSVPTSTPADAREDTLLARMRDYAQRLRPRHGYVGVVHRLDRDTSGALALALDPATRGALRTLFRAHTVERRYEALVLGGPQADTGRIEAPLFDGYQAGRRRVARRGEPCHAAVTHWRLLERFEGAARLELQLETGRQHQIRVHLAHAGWPVLGDTVYAPPAGAPHRPLPRGARGRPLYARRQMLHAARLEFVHPHNGLHVRAESPLPRDYLWILAALRRAAPQRPGATGRGE